MNRRTFSTAITAWSAKVWNSAICLSRERAGLDASDWMVPIGAALAQHRDDEKAGQPGLLSDRHERVLGVLSQVRDVHDGAPPDRPPRGVAPLRRTRKARWMTSARSGDVLGGRDMEQLAIVP